MKNFLLSLFVLLMLTAQAQNKDPFKPYLSAGATMSHGETWGGLEFGAATHRIWYGIGFVTSKFDNDMYGNIAINYRVAKLNATESYLGISGGMKLDRMAEVGLTPVIRVAQHLDKNLMPYFQLNCPLSEVDNYKYHNLNWGIGMQLFFR